MVSETTRIRLIWLAEGLFVLGAVFYLATRQAPSSLPKMPPQASREEEQKLYGEPAGKWTLADIAANGSQSAADKYAGFQAAHDPSPRPGQRVCPITKTKANPACTWIVGGAQYEFCCPPCIDEFVRRAKTDPESIEPPEAYIQK